MDRPGTVPASVSGQLGQLAHHVAQHHAHRHHPLGAAATADGVDLLLGGLQHIAGGAAALLHHGGDAAGGLGHLAHERLVLHNADVLHDVSAGGGDLHQLQQIGTGIVVIQSVLLQLAGHGDAVDGLGVDEHMVDRLEDLPVGPQIEILGLQLVHHVLDAVGVDEHGAQHRLLRLRGMGHGRRQQGVGVVGHGKTSFQNYGNSRACGAVLSPLISLR